jgi:hypothetical protein
VNLIPERDYYSIINPNPEGVEQSEFLDIYEKINVWFLSFDKLTMTILFIVKHFGKLSVGEYSS